MHNTNKKRATKRLQDFFFMHPKDAHEHDYIDVSLQRHVYDYFDYSSRLV
jgi:hypothetical protein